MDELLRPPEQYSTRSGTGQASDGAGTPDVESLVCDNCKPAAGAANFEFSSAFEAGGDVVTAQWRGRFPSAGVDTAAFHDLRPMALSDARRQGRSVGRDPGAAGRDPISPNVDGRLGPDGDETSLGRSLPKLRKAA